MSFSLSDITFLIRLLLDILVVWGLIYSGLRIVRNNSRTILKFVVCWRKLVKQQPS